MLSPSPERPAPAGTHLTAFPVTIADAAATAPVTSRMRARSISSPNHSPRLLGTATSNGAPASMSADMRALSPSGKTAANHRSSLSALPGATHGSPSSDPATATATTASSSISYGRPLSPARSRSPSPSRSSLDLQHAPMKRRLSASQGMFDDVKESTVTSHAEDDSGTTRINQYQFIKFLGKGAYGTVYQAIDTTTGVEYAIKEFSKSRVRKAMWAMSSRTRMAAMRGRGRGRGGMPPGGPGRAASGEPAPGEDDPIVREAAILKKLHHPHCVKMFEVLEIPDGDQLFMVFELCSGGAIMKLGDDGVSTGEFYSMDRARDYFQMMVLGFEYLHEHNIVHRDIKPDNLLLSGDNELKIVDFGVSEMFSSKDEVSKTAGSPAFMAPELCNMTSDSAAATASVPAVPSASNGSQATDSALGASSMGSSANSLTPSTRSTSYRSGRAADVWSLGVTLYCMVFGRVPFTGFSIVDLYESICHSEPNWTLPAEAVPQMGDPQDIGHLDHDLLDLLTRMLDKNPATRITLDEVRAHPWVTDHDEFILPTKEENVAVIVSPDDITKEDVAMAVSKVLSAGMVAIRFIAKLRRRASATSLVNSRRSSVASDTGSTKSASGGAMAAVGVSLEAAAAAAVRAVAAMTRSASPAPATPPESPAIKAPPTLPSPLINTSTPLASAHTSVVAGSLAESTPRASNSDTAFVGSGFQTAQQSVAGTVSMVHIAPAADLAPLVAPPRPNMQAPLFLGAGQRVAYTSPVDMVPPPVASIAPPALQQPLPQPLPPPLQQGHHHHHQQQQPARWHSESVVTGSAPGSVDVAAALIVPSAPDIATEMAPRFSTGSSSTSSTSSTPGGPGLVRVDSAPGASGAPAKKKGFFAKLFGKKKE
ncbi:kinase-like domain-containing protein [Blastocladiella britannica]|nr:kinase-like domain-containing protein [Blastocladiella britannica]